MFKPTHTYHYAIGSNNKSTWPDGVPVMQGSTDKAENQYDAITTWLADDEGNIAGYSYTTDDFSHVIPLESE